MTSSAIPLLQRAREGSPEALDELFERFSGKLLALIRLRMGALRNRMESRDVLQSTWIKALRGLDDFSGDDSSGLQAWLAAIARNQIHDLNDRHHADRRRLDREQGLSQPDALEASVASIVSRIALHDRSRRLEDALLELPERQREAVVLRNLEELSFVEMSERLGRSPDACRMLYSRSLAALTLLMRGSEEPVTPGPVVGEPRGDSL